MPTTRSGKRKARGGRAGEDDAGSGAGHQSKRARGDDGADPIQAGLAELAQASADAAAAREQKENGKKKKG